MKKYKINEIFGPTIQGEGLYIGTPVMFVRFAECNLQCSFCDTDFSIKKELTPDEIMNELKIIDNGVNHLVLTGGEPLLQVDLELYQKLSQKYYLHLETNGTIEPFNYDWFTHITCSPKTSNIKLKKCHDLKLLYPFIVKPGELNINHNNLYIQPLENQCNWIDTIKACVHYQARLSPQLHKLIGVK